MPSRGKGDPGRSIHKVKGVKVKVPGGLRQHEGQIQGWKDREGDPGTAGLGRASHSRRTSNLDSSVLSPHSRCTVCVLKTSVCSRYKFKLYLKFG